VIIALTVAEYELLLTQAHAEVAGDPLLGWRDVAIIRTLGECGLRAEELCQLQRRDYRPTRKGARKRELHIRHGKGSRTRSVPASANVRRAVVRWDQLRRQQAPGTQGQPVENDPLFVTIGVRRRDGGYSALGRQVTYDTNAEVIKRLGERAELPAEKRAQDQANPCDSGAVAQVLSGIRRRHGTAPERPAAPLDLSPLQQVLAELDTSTLAGLRDRALLLLGFAAALRRSELVALDVEHLQLSTARGLLVRIASAGDRLPDPPSGVGGELKPLAVVKPLRRADEADGALLDQVKERHPLVAVVLRDRDDQPKVRLDHLLLRAQVATLDPLGELNLLPALNKGSLLMPVSNS
jgi:site-specific recombinase XerC